MARETAGTGRTRLGLCDAAFRGKGCKVSILAGLCLRWHSPHRMHDPLLVSHETALHFRSGAVRAGQPAMIFIMACAVHHGSAVNSQHALHEEQARGVVYDAATCLDEQAHARPGEEMHIHLQRHALSAAGRFPSDAAQCMIHQGLKQATVNNASGIEGAVPRPECRRPSRILP